MYDLNSLLSLTVDTMICGHTVIRSFNHNTIVGLGSLTTMC